MLNYEKCVVQEPKMNKNRGFTLIELMVTLAIIVIIVMMSAPSFSAILKNQQLNSNTRSLIATLSKARNHAITSRVTTKVHFSSGTDTDTEYYWQATAQNSLTAPSSITEIQFNKDGTVVPSISADTDFIICNSATGKSKGFALSKMGTIYPKSDGTC